MSVFLTPWPMPPIAYQATMKGKTVQNGTTNFAKPCSAAASSATVAIACTGTRCGSVLEATIIPVAHTVSTRPTATPER